ncbi:MAG: phospholipase D-like domain-containing protein [Pseudohongiellaceae bacterium]
MSFLIWSIPFMLLGIAVYTAGHALLNKRDSRAAFGWIALCIILPLAGPVIYLLFGINRVRSRARRDYLTKVSRGSLQTISDPHGTRFRPLSTVGETVTRKGLSSCNSLDVLINGEALYPAMLEAIDNAQQRVLLASYIFDNDGTGERFVTALCRAKERGVDVRVMLDGLGECMSLPRIGTRLRKAGIRFVRFNPITLFPPSLNINMRNHRKMLIVDNLYAFTGGQNIGDRHLAVDRKKGHSVLDIHFRLTGKIVDELEWAFWQDWRYCEGKTEPTTFRGRNVLVPDASIWSRLVLDGPNRHFDKLNNLLVGIISAARSRVWIMTPYFLPTSDLIGAILAAHFRGVDVLIVLPGENNIKLADWASRNILRQILEHQVDVRHQPPPFVHSKLLLVDNHYTLIGSANMDPRSLRLNYELGVELFSESVNAELTGHFERQARAAMRMTIYDLEARSLPVRIRDSLAWLFSPYL